MATIELSIRSKTAVTTDVGALWKAAIDRYEEITTIKIKSLAGANNVDEILDEIRGRDAKFKGQRHDGSKSDKFRSLVSKSLGPIETLSNIVASAALAVRN
jgi:ankyrin repeat domain-containing protein 50